MSMEIDGRRGQIFVLPTCWRLMVFCAACGLDYSEGTCPKPSSYAPATQDTAAWRAYLVILGWTQGGTVCLTCSRATPEQTKP